jgi:transposase
MAYKKINDETRARVIAHLFTGMLPAQISEVTGVSEATISRLRRKIPEEVLNHLQIEREKLETERAEFERDRSSITTLIEKHLEASLKACVKIMEQVNDRDWINRQPADALALFYGVATDKAVRILAAMAAADERRSDAARAKTTVMNNLLTSQRDEVKIGQ